MPQQRKGTLRDVKTLNTLAPQPGDVVPWETLEALLGLPRTARRFRTIYRAWMRYLRKWHNRTMVVVPRVGLRLLHERERIATVRQTLTRGLVLLEQARTDAEAIPIEKLTEAEAYDACVVRQVVRRHATPPPRR